VFDGNGSETTYKFSVTGDVEESSDLGAVETADSIDGSSVSGSVTDDKDGFRFSGDLENLKVNGNSNVRFEDNDG